MIGTRYLSRNALRVSSSSGVVASGAMRHVASDCSAIRRSLFSTLRGVNTYSQCDSIVVMV